MPTSVTFLRHAESTGNVAARTRGQAGLTDPSLVDCPLTEAGLAQARAVRGTQGPFTAVWCSPALRCRQTLLEAFPEAVGWPVRIDWRLAEGRGWATFNEIALVESELPEPWIRPYDGPVDPRAERETEGDVDRRVASWWRDVLAFDSSSRAGGGATRSQAAGVEKAEAKILVVTHRWPIALWIATFRDVDYAPGNCEFVTFTGWETADDVASIGRSSIDADDLSDASDI